MDTDEKNGSLGREHTDESLRAEREKTDRVLAERKDAATRCIVEAHGGRIWAESALGEGSRVYVTIPGVGASREQSR